MRVIWLKLKFGHSKRYTLPHRFCLFFVLFGLVDGFCGFVWKVWEPLLSAIYLMTMFICMVCSMCLCSLKSLDSFFDAGRPQHRRNCKMKHTSLSKVHSNHYNFTLNLWEN